MYIYGKWWFWHPFGLMNFKISLMNVSTEELCKEEIQSTIKNKAQYLLYYSRTSISGPGIWCSSQPTKVLKMGPIKPTLLSILLVENVPWNSSCPNYILKASVNCAHYFSQKELWWYYAKWSKPTTKTHTDGFLCEVFKVTKIIEAKVLYTSQCSVWEILWCFSHP